MTKPQTDAETYIHRANVPFLFKIALAGWLLFITAAIALPYMFFGAYYHIAFLKFIGMAMIFSNFFIFYFLFLNKKTVILIKSKK